jgi:hypothetical protein
METDVWQHLQVPENGAIRVIIPARRKKLHFREKWEMLIQDQTSWFRGK